MDGSCMDESTTTNSTSTPSPAATKSPEESLCRVGSGTSVILDSEGGVEAESRKLPSSKYKGVVPQPNGRWGAQIYEKHQRVWLGTFNEEEEAAKAYDVAAQRFRGRDAVANFKQMAAADHEMAFLSSHSKSEIVDMLRKHTYTDELDQSKRRYGQNKTATSVVAGSDRVLKAREQLFEKAVTPSDVGKLNRLVIPKQHAEKHFPLQSGSTSSGVLLNFEDVAGKVWRFRYSYWNSSQSYVLTKGWSRFVKEKNLKAGDVVSFHSSTGGDKQLYIDWKAINGPGSVETPVEPVQMMRLFGVNIFKIPRNGVGVDEIWCNNNGKRLGEMELLSLECSKNGNAQNRCGPSFGNAKCAAGYCCSGAGYCGNSPDHCNAPDCLFDFGPACDANKTPAGASTRNDARPKKGNVNYGGAGIYACRKPGTVAITYDDGPYTYTDEVLNKFAAAGFKATFFVTGINIGKGAIDEKWAPVIRRMVADGHQVASHTWSHQDLSKITEAQVYDQMVKNEMAIRNIIGKYPTYMRPPYSSCNTVCQNVLAKLGYVISYFDLDTDDYNQLTREKIEVAKNNFRNAINPANPATQSKLAIAHDIHELTALNLTVTMIETLQARGFKGVTMGECMNEPVANWYRDSTPGSPAPSSTRATTGPTSTPTGTVSTDGSCGPQGKNQICNGSSFGNCCSQYGWCGKSTDHCGTGCNALFGTCGTSSAPASSSAAPQPTAALKTSVDGTCGKTTGYTCVGFVHEGVKSECCSQYGYCGASTGHCGTGCNPLAGKCGSK